MRSNCALTTTLLFVVLSCCACAFALDPSLDVSQYAHTSWRVRDGFVKGAILSIAQTPDGYLWLGTDFGLVRFDGVRAVPWQPPTGEQLPNNFVSTLFGARDGALWIGTHSGLARWKDGKLTSYPQFVGMAIYALIEDHSGTVWIGAFGAKDGNLCAAKGSTMNCYGAGQFGHGIGALFEDHKGNLWVAAETGLWRWAPGTPERYSYPRGWPNAASLIEDESGALLISSFRGGLGRLVGGKIEPYPLPGVAGQFSPVRLLRSKDGIVWVGSTQGLFHLHRGSVDSFAAVDGLSSDFAHALFEDREGNVWVGTSDGLDRFHDLATPTISQSQGLLHSAAWSVLATADGSIWIATADGLNRWDNGHVTIYRSRKALARESGRDKRRLSVGENVSEVLNSGLTGDTQSLGHDDRGRLWASTTDGVFYNEGARFVRVPGVPGGTTYSITGDGHGSVWINNLEQGLFSWAEGGAVQRIPQLGQRRALDLLPDRQRGGMWLGFFDGGIAYFQDGQVRASYNTADGLGSGQVTLRLGSGSELWAATEGGLSLIKEGKVATLTSKNGLPCDAVHWSIEDDDHATWLYMPCGLVRIAQSELDAWMSDKNHVIQTTIFDITDGVRTNGIPSGFFPHVTKSPDGKIWFPQRDGVSFFDPRHIPFNKLPPPVHIEQITSDRKIYDASGGLRLPPLVRDLEIDYTALSLVVPEKNLFRYKLEGFDEDWQDVGNRRQAFYTNLPPRTYRFRVIACNNSGVWNQTGDSFEFSIAPAYYQTIWFRILIAIAILAFIWALYRLRLSQMQRQFAIGAEARVNERTRIARELHDTLLQSLHGVMFQFQAARNMLPRSPDEAAKAMDGAILETEQAIADSRDAIHDLRNESANSSDLGDLLNTAGEELAEARRTDHHAPVFRLVVEGERRALSAELQDEVFRIAHEILRNAFQHSRAKRIEAEIRYDDRELRLRVRDDGIGVDPTVLEQGGRPGHWGLRGIHERAKKMGSHLDFWSEAGAGTEVQLTVPAAVAYDRSGKGSGSRHDESTSLSRGKRP